MTTSRRYTLIVPRVDRTKRTVPNISVVFHRTARPRENPRSKMAVAEKTQRYNLAPQTRRGSTSGGFLLGERHDSQGQTADSPPLRLAQTRSEERRVGKECRSRWS